MGEMYQQIVLLYAFIGLGILFGKWKKNIAAQSGILSFLLVHLFFPAKIFLNFSENCTVYFLKDRYIYLIVSTVLLVILHFLSKPISRLLTKDRYERNVFEYSTVISNYGYLGYTLVETVMGDLALTDLILFCIPFGIYTYSVGYMKLTGSKKIDLKKLANPLMIFLMLGSVFGLTGIGIPGIAADFLSLSSRCVGPVSMLLTGLTLSQLSFRELFSDKSVYAISAVRLVAVPAFVYLLFTVTGFKDILPWALIMACMPSGLNTIVYPKLVGLDPSKGAKISFISHLISCVTLPLWLLVII